MANAISDVKVIFLGCHGCSVQTLYQKIVCVGITIKRRRGFGHHVIMVMEATIREAMCSGDRRSRSIN